MMIRCCQTNNEIDPALDCFIDSCANDNIHKDFRKAIGANCIFYSAQTHELIVLVSTLNTHFSRRLLIKLMALFYVITWRNDAKQQQKNLTRKCEHQGRQTDEEMWIQIMLLTLYAQKYCTVYTHCYFVTECVDIHSQMFVKAIGLYTSANASVFKKYKRSPESKQF